jgi:flagellin-like hook-associated protein FlgL
VNDDVSFQYGERSDAGKYWDNTGSALGWYSQTYYGGDTSYFFANDADPASVILAAEVYKQNDVNASLLFMYDGKTFTVRGKGFDRDGNLLLDDDEQTLTAAEMVSIASGGPVTIHGIRFTNLEIDLAELKSGDKFVINVAAAKLDGINYGPLSGQHNPLNGSLIFDVLDVTDSVIKFRIQGHIIDLNGNEWYAEEEEFSLNAGRNTSRDSTVIPPIIPSEVTDPLVIFRDSDFGGLFFDEFTLKNYDRWMTGDRFTVALTASGRESADIDEITLSSDNRGTNMPASYRFYDGVLDNSDVDLHIYQLANNIAREDSSHMAVDQVMDGKLSLSFGNYHPAVGGTQPEIIRSSASFNTAYQKGMDAGVAHYYSRAEDIKQFWDSSGRFILENNEGRLTIRMADSEMRFTIGSGMEMGQMARFLSERIWLELLGQDDGIAGGVGDRLPSNDRSYLMNSEDMHKIVQFVNFTPGKSSNEAVPGTFLAHSVLTGRDNELKFYGEDDIMKAFNFVNVQEARDTMFDLSVSDAHSGRTVSSGQKIVAGERIYNIIVNGLSLDIDSSIGLTRSSWDAKRGVFQAEVRDNFSQILHLADNAATLQIGANEGESMYLTLSDVTAGSLGIDDIDVRNHDAAARGVTKLDNALRKVSSQRAIIGAQINRLDHTISNLETASINLTDSMSRIEDADMAREIMEFTKLNIIAQAGSSMLAQANQITGVILSLLR